MYFLFKEYIVSGKNGMTTWR